MESTRRKPFGWFAAASLVALGCSDGAVTDDDNEASAGHVAAGVGGSAASNGGSNGASPAAVAGKNELGAAAGRTATFANGGLGQGGGRGGRSAAGAASGGELGYGGSSGGGGGAAAGAAGATALGGTGGVQSAGAGQVGVAGAASAGAPGSEPPIGGAPSAGSSSGAGASSGGRGGASSGGRGGAASGGSAGMAVITLPFKEDFEDGNTTGWNLQYVNSYTASLQPGTGANGSSRSLLLTKTQETGYCCDGFSRQFAAGLAPSRVSFWLRSDASGTGTDAGYVRLSSTTDATLWLAYVSFYQNNITLSAAQSYVTAFMPGRFYHLEFRAINWTQRTFQYWVDGTQIAAAVGMKDAAAASVKRIDLYGRTANKSAFIDEIELAP